MAAEQKARGYTSAQLKRFSRNPDIRAVLVLYATGELNTRDRDRLLYRFGVTDLQPTEASAIQDMMLQGFRKMIE